MTISEQSRHAMFVQLESVLGEEAALILMEHLPPVGWADVATKRDLDQLHTLVQRDIDLAIAKLGAEMRGEIYQLGTDLRHEMSQMSERISTQSRTHVFTAIGSVVSVAALTLTAVRLG